MKIRVSSVSKATIAIQRAPPLIPENTAALLAISARLVVLTKQSAPLASTSPSLLKVDAKHVLNATTVTQSPLQWQKSVPRASIVPRVLVLLRIAWLATTMIGTDSKAKMNAHPVLLATTAPLLVLLLSLILRSALLATTVMEGALQLSSILVLLDTTVL